MLPQVSAEGFGGSEVHAGTAGKVSDADGVGVAVKENAGGNVGVTASVIDSTSLDAKDNVDEEAFKLPSEGANGIVA